MASGYFRSGKGCYVWIGIFGAWLSRAKGGILKMVKKNKGGKGALRATGGDMGRDI